MPEPRTRIRLCGPLEFEIDGRSLAAALPAGQAATLLCYLVATRERASDRDELIDVVWPDRSPSDPQAALRPLLSRLRRVIAPATFEGTQRLRLALPEPVWLDTEEAVRELEAVRAAARGAEWETARACAQTVTGLLRPGLLPGQRGDWVDALRRQFEELELEALEWVARSSLALGAGEAAGVEAASRELIARSPYRETGYRFLMEALAAAGNAAEALRVYERLRVLLRDELGATPAAEIQALHGRLLAADGGARAGGPAAAGSGSPRVPLPSVLSPGERTAFVGRQPELDVLRAAWARARSGRRGVVLLAGEPGIGKTRLASEFALEAHDHGTVLYAGCQEETLVSYQPFVEALRHFARSTQFDWESVTPTPGAAELVRLIPELAGRLPAPEAAAADDPATRRYLLFDAVATLLADVSAGAPLALVLDDLHWADPATLHLLRHVIRAPLDASLLIVGTYRDGEVGGDHPLFGLLADLRRDRLVERVALTGLDARGVGALIASHAGHEAHAGLVGTIHDETEGNPFFVEEVMRHLIETGVIFAREGRWVSALTADEIGVPEGVKEVLASRLGRLSEACRSALSQAAVLGRRFDFEVLRAMAGAEEEALIEAVEEAIQAQLLVEVQPRGGPGYAFTHALVRETLYSDLSGPRRQRMHARAAHAIEGGDRAAQVPALAVHYRLAGSAGDPAKAVRYSLEAGNRARELSDWDEAATHWEGALEVLARADGREAERARLLVALADLMVVAGDLARQIAYLEQALALHETLGDDERAAQVHSRLGMAHSLIDSIYADHLDLGRAFGHFDAARAVLERGPVRKGRGHLETGVSTAMTYGVRQHEGIEAGAHAMEIAEQLGDEVLWAGAAQAFAWHKIVSGALAEGLATLQRAFDVADRQQRPFLAWMGTNIRGQLTWGLGAPDEAQPFFDAQLRRPYAGKTAYRQAVADGIGRCHVSRGEADEARRRLPDARAAWITHSLKPLLDLWEGRWEEVESLAATVLATSRRNGNRWDEWAAYHLSARVLALRGELEPAAELHERGLSIVVAGGARYWEMWARPDLARVLADSGHLGEARVHVERCREIVAGGENWRGRAGHAALAEAVVLGYENRMDDARLRFGEALAIFERQRLRCDQADALHQWGRALSRAGDRATAAEKLDSALEIYRARGAGSVWLDRVHADRHGPRAAGR